MDNLIIRKKSSRDAVPWDLLLMADPSVETIQKYLSKSEIYLACIEKDVVGILVIYQGDNNISEIKNIAVSETYQRKGIGKLLIMHAIKVAKSSNALRLEIGTGNSSELQIKLYQACGFKIIGVDKDFFVRNYKEIILENGIQCGDMIRLSHQLS